MKIELNPSRMSIEELNDAIVELSAHRDRLMEEQRHEVEKFCGDTFGEALALIGINTREYDITLNIQPRGRREYRIPLHIPLAWSIEVTERKPEPASEPEQ